MNKQNVMELSPTIQSASLLICVEFTCFAHE